MTIHEQENILFEEWEKSYPKNERRNFVMDGLCYNGDLYNNGYNSYSGNEEELWTNSKRRIVFLMKDSNSNPGEDYREWPWRTITHKFFKTIFNWLQGLSETTAQHIPRIGNGDYLDPANQTVLKYPLAIVNVKKMSGGSSVQNGTLYDYAFRDTHFLKKQIREILKPNIIVCGGGSGSILDIAKKYIFPDLQFNHINNWCYHSEKTELLLIDSWHPSSRISNIQKIDDMMTAVSDFINQTNFK